MTKKKKDTKKKYLIEVNEDQLFALEKGCDMLARMICGQDSTFQELIEKAWHKNVQEKQNLDYSGEEFWDMREEVEQMIMRMKALCWNLSRNANYGVKYSEESDILIDMYHSFRYRRFLDMTPEQQEVCRMGVMGDPPMHYSETCPLPIVTRIYTENDEKKK